MLGDKKEENAPMMDGSKECDGTNIIVDNSKDDEEGPIPDMSTFVENDDVSMHSCRLILMAYFGTMLDNHGVTLSDVMSCRLRWNQHI